jgi:hypothetical protein
VTEARNGFCSGCHMSIGVGQFAVLMRQEVLHTCEHCGRFLYVSKDASPRPEAETAADKRKKPAKAKKSAVVVL